MTVPSIAEGAGAGPAKVPSRLGGTSGGHLHVPRGHPDHLRDRAACTRRTPDENHWPSCWAAVPNPRYSRRPGSTIPACAADLAGRHPRAGGGAEGRGRGDRPMTPILVLVPEERGISALAQVPNVCAVVYDPESRRLPDIACDAEVLVAHRFDPVEPAPSSRSCPGCGWCSCSVRASSAGRTSCPTACACRTRTGRTAGRWPSGSSRNCSPTSAIWRATGSSSRSSGGRRTPPGRRTGACSCSGRATSARTFADDSNRWL